MNNKSLITDEKEESNLSVTDLIRIFWLGKYWIVLITFIPVICAIFYLNYTQFKYSVSMKVIPISKPVVSKQSESIKSMSSSFGLSNMNMQSNSYDYELYKELLKSYNIAVVLEKDQEFMTTVFASEWDTINKEWKEKKLSIFSKLKNFIKDFIGIPVFNQEKPGSKRLNKFLSNNLNISAPKESKISSVNISILTTDPKFGKLILEKVHNVSNEILRIRSSKRTNEYIKFLNQQLLKTQQQDQRAILISSLASQLQQKMSENSDLPFVSEKFGEIYVTSTPVSPNSKSILTSSIIVGFFTSIIFLMIRSQIVIFK